MRSETDATDVHDLHDAAAEGELKRVKRLLEEGAPIDARDAGGATALMRAAVDGHDRVVGALIKAGADLDLRDGEGMSALLHAVWMMGQPQVTEWRQEGTAGGRPCVFLIEHGAFWIEENGSRYPMAWSRLRKFCREHMPVHDRYLGRLSTAKRLLKAKADPSGTVEDGRSCVHLAAGHGEAKLLDALVRALGEQALDVADDIGRRPAHYAAASHRRDLWDQSKALRKADLEVVDGSGWLPLHHAVASGCDGIVRHLIERRSVSLAIDPQPSVLASNREHAELSLYLAKQEGRVAPPVGGAPEWLLKQGFSVIDARHDLEELLAALSAEKGYLVGLPRQRPHREGYVRLNGLRDAHWVEAWVGQDGSVEDLRLHPAETLRKHLRDAVEDDGRVMVMYADARAYPPGTLEALNKVLGEGSSSVEELADGTKWLEVGTSGFTLMNHPTRGPISLHVKDGAVVSVSPSVAERLAEEGGRDDARVAPVPAAARDRIDAIAARVDTLKEAVDEGRGAVVMSRINDDIRAFARLEGVALLMHYVDGAIREVRWHRAEERLTESLWSAASSAHDLAAMPELDGARGHMLKAALAGDWPALVKAAGEGWLVARGKRTAGSWKLTGSYGHAELSDTKMDADAIVSELDGATVNYLALQEPPAADDAAPAVDDAALAAKADATSPAELVDAVRRSGVKGKWRVPGPLEVSIWGYTILFFDGSDRPQTFGAFLRDGPLMPVPDEVASEIREAVRRILSGLG